MGKAALHPVCQTPAPAVDECCPDGESDDNSNNNKTAVTKAAVVLGVREVAFGCRQEDREYHQHSKRSYVENTFHRPHPDLGRNGQILATCDQVRPDEFTGSSQQRQSREPNQRGRNQLQKRSSGTYGAKKNPPADCPQHVSQVDESNSMDNVPRVDLVGFAPESGPVETLPVTELQIYQGNKYDQNPAGYENTFFIHLHERAGRDRAGASIPYPQGK